MNLELPYGRRLNQLKLLQLRKSLNKSIRVKFIHSEDI